MTKENLLFRCIFTLFSAVVTPSALAEVPFWDESVPVPATSEIEAIEGARFHVIQPHAPEVDGFPWLHGVALASHKGKFYASFGRNRGAENTAGEEAHARVSLDGGKTWGPISVIDVGDEEDLAVSHGVFLSHGDRLWAFQGAFYNSMERVHTRAYVLDESVGVWILKGVVVEDGFWPMQEPLTLGNGKLIMSGFRAYRGEGGKHNPAAVALGDVNDLTAWSLVHIPKPDDLNMWGESTVIVGDEKIVNIARWREPWVLYSESRDGGKTWTASERTNMPMAASKPYTGTLSTGQRYLICTTTADAGNRRSPLTIAVTKPGADTFSKIYMIRDAVHDGPGESTPKARLSYPYAIEHEGNLYVGYSNDGGRGKNQNSAELAILPIKSLTVD